MDVDSGYGDGSTQCVGTEWVIVAQDRAVWRAKIDAMIKWREQNMANRKCGPVE